MIKPGQKASHIPKEKTEIEIIDQEDGKIIDGVPEHEDTEMLDENDEKKHPFDYL